MTKPEGLVNEHDLDTVPYAPGAVEELADRHGERALAMVGRHGFPRADAEAIVSDAFLALIKSWQQRGSLAEPERLLFITVKQRMANEFRRRKRKPVDRIDSDEGIAAAADALWQHHFADPLIDRIDVQNALRELPHRQRAVLVLRFLDDLEITIVAALLGCSANDVKYAQKVGLRELRKSRWLSGYATTPEVRQ
ncbi:RNA polymerase sigma factor [Amycolatopsis jejuensis]|uniref:RNA polymerase sigma factor n=1 Tax=Amycolatopsis jejuensis TaxID=330084 RepID=UPI0005269F02|nr:sigma-70 family RNA polymerase sigma factor [Amycolatopsis jejuensis]